MGKVHFDTTFIPFKLALFCGYNTSAIMLTVHGWKTDFRHQFTINASEHIQRNIASNVKLGYCFVILPDSFVIPLKW